MTPKVRKRCKERRIAKSQRQRSIRLRDSPPPQPHDPHHPAVESVHPRQVFRHDFPISPWRHTTESRIDNPPSARARLDHGRGRACPSSRRLLRASPAAAPSCVRRWWFRGLVDSLKDRSMLQHGIAFAGCTWGNMNVPLKADLSSNSRPRWIKRIALGLVGLASHSGRARVNSTHAGLVVRHIALTLSPLPPQELL